MVAFQYTARQYDPKTMTQGLAEIISLRQNQPKAELYRCFMILIHFMAAVLDCIRMHWFFFLSCFWSVSVKNI